MLRFACAAIIMIFAFILNGVFDKVSIARERHNRTADRAPKSGHPALAQFAQR
jgi:hypothetical protein